MTRHTLGLSGRRMATCDFAPDPEQGPPRSALPALRAAEAEGHARVLRLGATGRAGRSAFLSLLAFLLFLLVAGLAGESDRRARADERAFPEANR